MSLCVSRIPGKLPVRLLPRQRLRVLDLRLRVPGSLPARRHRRRRRRHRRVVRPTAAVGHAAWAALVRVARRAVLHAALLTAHRHRHRDVALRLRRAEPRVHLPRRVPHHLLLRRRRRRRRRRSAGALPRDRARVELGVRRDGERRSARVPRRRHRGRPLENLRELRRGDPELAQLLFVQKPLRGLALLAFAKQRVHDVVVHPHASVRGDVEQDAEKRLDARVFVPVAPLRERLAVRLDEEPVEGFAVPQPVARDERVAPAGAKNSRREPRDGSAAVGALRVLRLRRFRLRRRGSRRPRCGRRVHPGSLLGFRNSRRVGDGADQTRGRLDSGIRLRTRGIRGTRGTRGIRDASRRVPRGFLRRLGAVRDGRPGPALVRAPRAHLRLRLVRLGLVRLVRVSELLHFLPLRRAPHRRRGQVRLRVFKHPRERRPRARLGCAVHAQTRPRGVVLSRCWNADVPVVVTRVAQRLVALLRLLDVPRAPTQRLGDGGARALPSKRTAEPAGLASGARVPRDDIPEERAERVHHVGGLQAQKRSLLRVWTRGDVPRGDVTGVSGAALQSRRRGERRRLRQRRHLRRRRREALELLLERRVGRVRTAEQAGDELHGALPADDLLVRGAPARDSRRVDVVDVILSLRIRRSGLGQIRSFRRSGKETGQTRAFRRVRARRTFQKSARSLARDKNATRVAPSSQERLERRGGEIDPEERNRAWDTPRVGSRRKSDDRSAGRREVTLEATSLESRRSAVGVAIAPRSMRGRTFRFKSPPLEAIVPGTRVA